MSDFVLNHLNDDHAEVIEALFEKYGLSKANSPKASAIDENGLTITDGNKVVVIPFIKKTAPSGYRDAIVELYTAVKNEAKFEKIASEMIEFIQTCNTVLISSIINDRCVVSYAPYVIKDSSIYAVLSSVALHFESIKANPDKISIMFLEDESKAATIFARVRASFEASAEFMECGDLKNEIFDIFESKYPQDAAIKHIRGMQDFHVVKFDIAKGRFVKGFGAAYDTDGFNVKQRAGEQNPHQYAPKK